MNSISIAKMIMYSIRAPPPPCRAARQRKAEEPSDETRSCLFFMVMGYLSFVNIYVPAPAKRASLLFLFFLKKEPKKSPEAGPAGPGQGLRPRRKPPAFASPAAFEKAGKTFDDILCGDGHGRQIIPFPRSPPQPSGAAKRRAARETGRGCGNAASGGRPSPRRPPRRPRPP